MSLFTGKERDTESVPGMFGARYLRQQPREAHVAGLGCKTDRRALVKVTGLRS